MLLTEVKSGHQSAFFMHSHYHDGFDFLLLNRFYKVTLGIYMTANLLNKLIALTLMLSLFLLGGCIRTPEWTLFYFADATDKTDLTLKHDVINGYYDTLEQCQAKGSGLLRIQGMSMTENVDFICGQQCQTLDDNPVDCQQSISDKDFLKQL
ncbi:hypothetical protein [Shewanella glacialimarina]|uniref:hypothetical protein n=1 Tax=Shewanella glacialimarina TaxID=2590884 RepID=UPI001CF90639|nr:hypothetical protein [Shewanella glacialimarina]UCX03360.1 hypothetical protein FJ709_01785 [Shewanella glacialimarina]